MTDPRLRIIKIKTGVVRRLTREKQMYVAEVEEQKEKNIKYRFIDKKDEVFLRKQEELLNESMMMVLDSQRRLFRAYDDLNYIITTENDLQGYPEYKEATQVLKQAEPELPKPGEVPHFC